MITEIEITGAVFKCQADEDIFYQRLSEITGLKKIEAIEFGLIVSVLHAQQSQAIADISVICDIWHTSFTIC